MDPDERHLRRAIRLAMNGRGRVEPNPMVGCVIVKDGRVLGEGYHRQFGGPHAEPVALAACTESAAGATAYVTLEPCCHTDKKTPPCAPRLIAERLARVVVGCLDPNPAVNGNGARMLRDAGVRVDGPVLEAECKQLIAPFLASMNQGRPYVTLKWAQSIDGKVSGPGGVRRQISNLAATRLVHVLRGRSDAIAVGIGTVLSDNPALTVRGVTPDRVPARLVFDSRLRIPPAAEVIATPIDRSKSEAVVFCGEGAGTKAKRERLDARGVILVESPVNDAGRLQIAPLLRRARFVARSHLLVEPGPRLAHAFLSYFAADRIWVIRSPNAVADDAALNAATVPDAFVRTGELVLDGDRLTEYLNTRSPAFFAPVPSADLVLAGV